MPHSTTDSDPVIHRLSDQLASAHIGQSAYDIGVRVLLHSDEKALKILPHQGAVSWIAKSYLQSGSAHIDSVEVAWKAVDLRSIIAIPQSSDQIYFTVQAQESEFASNSKPSVHRHRFYFDPSGSDIIFRNTSRHSIKVDTIYPQIETHTVPRSSSHSLSVGHHVLIMSSCRLYMRILPRVDCSLHGETKADSSDTDGEESAITIQSYSKRRHLLVRRNNERTVAAKSTIASIAVLHDGQSLTVPATGAEPAYTIKRHKDLAPGNTNTQVILAESDKHEGILVVKRTRWTGNVKTADRFHQECSITGRLDHESIVKLLFSDARLLTMHLERIGWDLRAPRWCNRDGTSKLTEDQVFFVLASMASALSYCHEEGIVHHDLKPGNILLDDHQCKLCDFGMGQEITDPSPAGATPGYLGPEFKTDQRGVQGTRGPPGDVWALGIVVLWLQNAMMRPDKNELCNRMDIRAVAAGHEEAGEQMDQWIRHVVDKVASLRSVPGITARATEQMLKVFVAERITARQLHDGILASKKGRSVDDNVDKPAAITGGADSGQNPSSYAPIFPNVAAAALTHQDFSCVCYHGMNDTIGPLRCLIDHAKYGIKCPGGCGQTMCDIPASQGPQGLPQQGLDIQQQPFGPSVAFTAVQAQHPPIDSSTTQSSNMPSSDTQRYTPYQRQALMARYGVHEEEEEATTARAPAPSLRPSEAISGHCTDMEITQQPGPSRPRLKPAATIGQTPQHPPTISQAAIPVPRQPLANVPPNTQPKSRYPAPAQASTPAKRESGLGFMFNLDKKDLIPSLPPSNDAGVIEDDVKPDGPSPGYLDMQAALGIVEGPVMEVDKKEPTQRRKTVNEAVFEALKDSKKTKRKSQK